MKYMDMHCDTISRLYNLSRGGVKENLIKNEGHLDLVRMKAGGCLAQNFALYTNLNREADPYGYGMALCDLFKREMADNKELLHQVTSVEEILENERAERMSAVLTIEEGGICKGDTKILRQFYDQGVRMMTLTWNFENELAFPNRVNLSTGVSIPETERGLTKKGIEFVELMEELRMIVDVSHLGDAGFLDIVKMTKAPFAASHSNARTVASHVRNLTDEMIHTLSERGGVMGINFCAAFLNDSEREKEVGRSLVSDMVRHIKHIKNVGGIECIGLGTDFDGVGSSLELDSPAALHLLSGELASQGFSEEEIEKIFYKNVLRLYKDVWGQ